MFVPRLFDASLGFTGDVYVVRNEMNRPFPEQLKGGDPVDSNGFHGSGCIGTKDTDDN